MNEEMTIKPSDIAMWPPLEADTPTFSSYKAAEPPYPRYCKSNPIDIYPDDVRAQARALMDAFCLSNHPCWAKRYATTKDAAFAQDVLNWLKPSMITVSRRAEVVYIMK